MRKSNGKLHDCKNEIDSLIHLFYRCHQIKHVLDVVKHIISFLEFCNLHMKMFNLENTELHPI